MNHYNTLKVTQDAPIEVINAAYKALALLYHPDRNIGNADAVVKMQEINVAFKVLSGSEQRAEYDAWLGTRERRANRSSSDKSHRRAPDPAESGDLKAQAEKAMAESKKWTLWAEKSAQDAKEAQARLDKAHADFAKAKEADRPKWEAWVAKMVQEAKEAKDKSDKAAAQSAKALADALELSAKAQPARAT
jgi:DnaJ-class molecular chaperone